MERAPYCPAPITAPGNTGPAHAKTKLLGRASWLELDRHPFVVIADKSLRILDAKEDERGVVRPLIVLAQALKMFPSGLAHFARSPVVQPRTSAQDQPTVARPPTRGLKALVLQQLLPHVFGARRHKPQLAVLNLCKRERTHMPTSDTPAPYSIRPRFLLSPDQSFWNG